MSLPLLFSRIQALIAHELDCKKQEEDEGFYFPSLSPHFYLEEIREEKRGNEKCKKSVRD